MASHVRVANGGWCACSVTRCGAMNATVSLQIPRANREQNFVRVLFIFDRAGEPPGADTLAGAYSLMRSQVRLQKLDFWMRNPDYLADELITEYMKDKSQTWALETAREILDSREPAIRRLPMLKWRFGAFEKLDDTLAIMTSRRLVIHQPQAGRARVYEHLYWLTDAGHDVAEQLLEADDAFRWYANRADVVARLAGDQGGAALAQRQYEHPEYGATNPLKTIRSIEDRVLRRLAELDEEAA